jgi:hypothetical protein
MEKGVEYKYGKGESTNHGVFAPKVMVTAGSGN